MRDPKGFNCWSQISETSTFKAHLLGKNILSVWGFESSDLLKLLQGGPFSIVINGVLSL